RARAGARSSSRARAGSASRAASSRCARRSSSPASSRSSTGSCSRADTCTRSQGRRSSCSCCSPGSASASRQASCGRCSPSRSTATRPAPRRPEHNPGVTDVLSVRELNRATLARQLLLERKRLSPTAVIERLVGLQAQWPSAPYVGIWTRTTSFRRAALERELVAGRVVKATVMRQTLHLVTLRDYALLRAAMSETNFPWMSALAGRLAPVVRALASAGPITSEQVHALLEGEHGLHGIDARRAWRAAR